MVSPYITVPLVTVIINQIIQFARASYVARQPVWSELSRFQGSQSALLALSAGFLATALAVGGLDSSLIMVGLIASLLVLRSEPSSRTRLDHAWTYGTGLLAGFLLNVDYWSESLSWFGARPQEDEATRWLYIFATIAVVSLLVSGRFRKPKFRKLPTSRRIQRAINITVFLPSMLGVGIALLQSSTSNRFMSDRISNWLLVAWIIGGSAWATQRVYRRASTHIKEEREHFIKDRKSKKRSKKNNKKRK